MKASDYKNKLNEVIENKITESDTLLEKNKEYIIKQVHRKIEATLKKGKDRIDLAYIKTYKEGLFKRTPLCLLDRENRRNVKHLIDGEMMRLGYNKNRYESYEWYL